RTALRCSRGVSRPGLGEVVPRDAQLRRRAAILDVDVAPSAGGHAGAAGQRLDTACPAGHRAGRGPDDEQPETAQDPAEALDRKREPARETADRAPLKGYRDPAPGVARSDRSPHDPASVEAR